MPNVAPVADELEPSATPLARVALASGPIATLSWPVALLSARVELLWKYLMPAPLLTRLSTVWLVANSCEPFTASVLVAFSAPAATLVSFTAVPAGLKVTWVLVAASSYFTATAAVLVTLVLRLLSAAPTSLLTSGPVLAPVTLMLLVE